MNEKQKALQTALDQIKKRFGAGAVMVLGENATMNVEAIPTGSVGLDLALGIGGVPRGRIVEIYGPEASGKTTVALHIVAEAQKMGGTAAYVDAEHALDPEYAKNLGVNVDSLLVSQPDGGEQALEITEELVRSGAIDVIVIDSVAALVPRQEFEGDIGQAQVGSQARLMSSALRKLQSVISKGNTVAIFINQLRQKIGVMYGNPETTTGGLALKYFSSVRIDIRKQELLKNGTEIIGAHTKAKIVKNKCASPFKEAEFDIMYGKGISRVGEIVDLGAKYNIIEKSGSWFSYNGEKIAQGRDNTKAFFESNPKLAEEVVNKIMVAVAEEKAKKNEETEKRLGIAPTSNPKEEATDAKQKKASVIDEDSVDITADDFN